MVSPHDGALRAAVQEVLRGFDGASRADFVKRAIERLGRAAGIDRVYVFEHGLTDEGETCASQRFEWCAPGIEPTLGDPSLQRMPYEAAGMGRWLAELHAGNPVAGHVEEFPETEREVLQAQAILSLAAVPIHVDGTLWGFVGFDAVRAPRAWRDGELSALLAAASAIGHQESRVRAERLLVEGRQRFERAVRGTREGIYDCDLDGGTVWYSPTFEALLGLDAGNLAPDLDAWRARIHEDDLEQVISAFEAHVERGTPYEVTYRMRHEDGEHRWFQDLGTLSAPDAGEGRRFSGAIADITERRRLEDALHQSQRLEAVGRLAGGVAHDFNNMLSVIFGYAELLKLELAGDEEALDSVHEIVKAASRSAKITQQLLAFARRQVVEPQTVDSRWFLHQMRGMLESLLGPRCRLELRLGDEAAAVRVDVAQMEQVIANLAANARDAMPDGGTLSVDVCTLELDEECARVHAGVEPGRFVRIAVSDTGEGMDAEVLEHVFEPFFTTKAPGRGTGLGLASARGIVERAGGFIRVHSELGSGTTFELHLPRVEPEAAA